MPVVLRINGYEFYFYSNENNEPIHMHVEKAEGEGKIWLEPELKIAFMRKFKPKHEKQIMQIVEENFDELKAKWNNFFNK